MRSSMPSLKAFKNTPNPISSPGPFRKANMDAVAISLTLLEDAQADHDLKRMARNYVDKGRSLLFDRHRSGAGGLEVAGAWSTGIGHLIRPLLAAIGGGWGDQL